MSKLNEVDLTYSHKLKRKPQFEQNSLQNQERNYTELNKKELYQNQSQMSSHSNDTHQTSSFEGVSDLGESVIKFQFYNSDFVYTSAIGCDLSLLKSHVLTVDKNQTSTCEPEYMFVEKHHSLNDFKDGEAHCHILEHNNYHLHPYIYEDFPSYQTSAEPNNHNTVEAETEHMSEVGVTCSSAKEVNAKIIKTEQGQSFQAKFDASSMTYTFNEEKDKHFAGLEQFEVKAKPVSLTESSSDTHMFSNEQNTYYQVKEMDTDKLEITAGNHDAKFYLRTNCSNPQTDTRGTTMNSAMHTDEHVPRLTAELRENHWTNQRKVLIGGQEFSDVQSVSLSQGMLSDASDDSDTHSGRSSQQQVQAVDKNKARVCRECSATFRYPYLLKRHMLTHTGEKPNKDKTHLCSECPAAFQYPCLLQRHMRMHSGKMLPSNVKCKPHVCSECSAAFSYPSFLERHMRIHTGEKPYVCEECGIAFAQTTQHRIHLREHRSVRQYVCNECGGATFSNSNKYKEHMRIHTVEKPYVCKECGTAFTNLKALKEHLILHTSHKPYICKECGAQFAASSTYKCHLKIHASEKPYTSIKCAAVFSSQNNLKAHTRSHTSKKTYKCHVCPATFRFSSCLKRHLQYKHGDHHISDSKTKVMLLKQHLPLR